MEGVKKWEGGREPNQESYTFREKEEKEAAPASVSSRAQQ